MSGSDNAIGSMKAISCGLKRDYSYFEKQIPNSSISLVVKDPSNKDSVHEFECCVADVVRELVPHYHDIKPHSIDDITLTYFNKGITNKLVCVGKRSAPDDDSFKVVLRVFGSNTSLVVDRHLELAVMIEHPMAPHIFGRFANGFVIKYTPGNTLSYEDVLNPHVSELVAAATRELHDHQIEGLYHQAYLYTTMRAYIDNLTPRIFADTGDLEKQALLDSIGGLEALVREVTWHEEQTRKMSGIPAPCLCHNDLLLGNILFDPKTDHVGFIDYEYCSYSYAPHDIANHFCEWAGFECAWEKYPTVEQQTHWVRAYLGDGATDAEVARWLEMVHWFELSSHLFWGIWAFLQGVISSIDFPYVPYGAKRIERYFQRKKEFLENKTSP